MASTAQIYALISQYVLVSEHKTSPAPFGQLHIYYRLVGQKSLVCKTMTLEDRTDQR